MGPFETDAFLEVVREHDAAFLDTSVAMSAAAGSEVGFDPGSIPDRVFEDCSASIMYGSDYPNVPYADADERRHLLGRDLSRDAYRDLFSRTAERFLGER